MTISGVSGARTDNRFFDVAVPMIAGDVVAGQSLGGITNFVGAAMVRYALVGVAIIGAATLKKRLSLSSGDTPSAQLADSPVPVDNAGGSPRSTSMLMASARFPSRSPVSTSGATSEFLVRA